MKLTGFKDRLYIRVIMVMYKKLTRLLIMFKLLMKILHKSSGKNLFFEIDFYFKYNILSLKPGEKRPQSMSIVFSNDMRIHTYYIQISSIDGVSEQNVNDGKDKKIKGLKPVKKEENIDDFIDDDNI